jgi:hypothetical protein
VALLAGLTALVTSTKVHPATGLEWLYILLGPAASFLLGSTWFGIAFRGRMAHQIINDIGSIVDLNKLLAAQEKIFFAALLLLALFAGAFLVQIVGGRVRPTDTTSAQATQSVLSKEMKGDSPHDRPPS